MLEATEADIRALEDQLAAVRRGDEGPDVADPASAAPDDGTEVAPNGVIVLPNGERLCAVCRTPLGEGAAFCPTCGVRL
jgi:hypothetical protein